MSSIQVNWVDLAIVLVLAVGVIRGRKRGMSLELLDMLKWLLVVVIAGFVYEPIGRMLAETTFFGLLSCYIFVYTLVLMAILLTFSFIRQGSGEKLVGSDFFGNTEYYLGMMAGGVRYACMILIFMAFLNARHYTAQEIQAQQRYQQDNFGSDYFPTLPDMQRHVFQESMAGRFVQDYLQLVLINPSAVGDSGGPNRRTIFRTRAREVNDVLAK